MRMQYSDSLRDHFENPRYVGRLDPNSPDIGMAVVGRRDTGGVLALHIQVDDEGFIQDTRFQAYGPPALIAAGSWLADNIRGRALEQAESVSQQDIADALTLPSARIYCALLAEDAIRGAIKNFKDKQRAYV